jgi:hypothetical protein
MGLMAFVYFRSGPDPARAWRNAMSTLRPLTYEETQDFRRYVANAATPQISRCTVPILSFRDRVAQSGSGVLLEIAGTHFLLTAAHVLDLAMEHGVCLALPPCGESNAFLPLNDINVLRTPVPFGGRDYDQEDVAVCELNPAIVSGLQPLRRFARLYETSRSLGFGPGVYMVMGYPTVFLRNPDGDPRRIASEPLRFVTNRYTGEALPHNPEVHVLLDYPAAGLNNDGAPVSVPDAPGLSGGGIWHLADPSTPANLWNTEDVRLVAIDNSWRRKERYVRGTNVAVALGMIYRAYECLRNPMEMLYPHLRPS